MSDETKAEALKRFIFNAAIGGVKFVIERSTAGALQYFVNDGLVEREEYTAVLATVRTQSIEFIQEALYDSDPGNGVSLADALDSIHTVLHDQLDPKIEDSFAAKLIEELALR